MTFRITGLAGAPFQALFDLDDDALWARRAQRVIADANPGFPCRVSLKDAEPGEELILMNVVHQPADTPYRASHAVFIRRGAQDARLKVGEVPRLMRIRALSLRAFDARGMMVDAELVEGDAAEAGIERLLGDPKTAYIHVHYAKYGCYGARIDRAERA